MSFWQLWKKEMNGIIWNSAFLGALLIVLVDLVFDRRKNVLWFPDDIHKLNSVHEWETPFGIPGTPLIVLTLWGIGMALYTLHHEWTNKSIYLLMSLPIKGYKVLGAKIAGVFCGVLAIIPLSVGIYLFTWHEKLAHFKVPALTAWYFGLTLVFVLLVIIFFFAMIGQFAYFITKLIKRFRVIVFIVAIYSVLKFLDVLAMIGNPLLQRIPDLVIHSGAVHFEVNVCFFLGWFLAGIALFFINCWIYERKIEL
jgi:hypothetical protein